MFILYTIIIALGISTSYTDIRFKEIKNNHLFKAAVFGLLAYIYLITTHQLGISINLLWNFLIGFGIGLLLYFSDIWKAGDAKLYIVLCLLMPQAKYPQALFFPAIAIYFSIFILSSLIIIILSAKQVITQRTAIFKKIFSWSSLTELGEPFLMLLSLKWIIEDLIRILIPQGSRILSFLILYLLYRIIRWIIKKIKINLILFFILSLGLIFRFLLHPESFHAPLLLSYLKGTLNCALIFYILGIISDLTNSNGHKKNSSNKNWETIPFSPFMFLGTLFANTNFLNWITHLLQIIKR